MSELRDSFFSLDASTVLESIDAALKVAKPGVQTTGYLLALNSLENRVFQIDLDDGSQVVAKFYRPERWSRDEIAEEHFFIDSLAEADLPVVPFLTLDNPDETCESLSKTKDGIFFAISKRVRGRLMDELDTTRLQSLGRYLARIHNVGESFGPEFRRELEIDSFCKEPLERLLDSGFIDPSLTRHYESAAKSFVELAGPKLKNLEGILIHGDCHLGNCLWNDFEAFFIDFDDCVVGPPVQDIWMIVRGRDEEAAKARAELLEAYEQFRSFDYSSLGAIEALRGLRIIYYSAWIAQRWADPSFPTAFPSFQTQQYWQEEIRAIHECAESLQGGLVY